MKYIKPEIEFVKIGNTDILTASSQEPVKPSVPALGFEMPYVDFSKEEKEAIVEETEKI